MAASKPTSWLFWNLDPLSHLIITWGPYLVVWAVALSSTDLSTDRLFPKLWIARIQSLVWVGKILLPLAIPVLYPEQLTFKTLPL